jgi:glycosyltransferase involved in cell wall biosynthesis
VLGYFGRMSDGKGIFTLLEAASVAMRDEPKLRCLWVGDGPDAKALRERVATDAALAHRHHFTGWTEDVHPFYNAISMLAFPSKRPETFGRVAVEAQACGIPVLGSDIGGVPETIQAGSTGLLLEPANVNAWYKGISSLINPTTRETMGHAAQAYVTANFSMPVIADAFADTLANKNLRLNLDATDQSVSAC